MVPRLRFVRGTFRTTMVSLADAKDPDTISVPYTFALENVLKWEP